jgi:hypothetical protein
VSILTLLAAIASALTAVAAFVRVGRWRDSDDAKRIDASIAKLEGVVASDDGAGISIKHDIHNIKNKIMNIDVRLTTAERASEKVSAIEGRLTGIETTLQHVASRSDISELKGEVCGIGDQARSAAEGVRRIESFLMEEKRG